MGVGHIHAHGLAEVESLSPVDVLLAEAEVEQEADLDVGEGGLLHYLPTQNSDY